MIKYINFNASFFPVVSQSYKVRVEVAAAARGCTAVLQCVIDRSVKDLVRVVAWVQDPSFFIYPSLQGGKFFYTFKYSIYSKAVIQSFIIVVNSQRS